jgi:hypothetical protein
MKLGFGDKKTVAPTNATELMQLLSNVMSAALNNEVDLDNARVALTAASRIVEVWQADTRMKAIAIASGRTINQTGGFAVIENEKSIEKH